MRILVGVEVDGRVTSMSLPASVPVAHLLPEVTALVSPTDTSRLPRTIDGEWLDVERSLADQGCTYGSVISLEHKRDEAGLSCHDPVAEIVERGPPVDLLPARASAAAVAGLCGVWIGTQGRTAAALAVIAAPVAWAALPFVGGAIAGVGRGLRALQSALGTAAVWAGGVALGAAGPLATADVTGLLLDVCAVCGVLAHSLRSSATNPFVRVVAGTSEFWCFGAVVPLGLAETGWSSW